MRALVFLLVLANLLFFAWTQGYFGQEASPDSGRLDQQLNPERLRIVGRGESPPEAPKASAKATPPTPAAPTAPEACLAWSGLIGADADRLAKLAGELAPAARLARHTESTTAKTWWLFIPPQANKADVDRKVAELRKLEVSDFFVVQEAGPNRLAISLGVFSTEAAANSHLESLRAKGVKSAKVGPRSGVEQHVGVEIRGAAAVLESVREAFAGHASGECPAAPAGTAKP